MSKTRWHALASLLSMCKFQQRSLQGFCNITRLCGKICFDQNAKTFAAYQFHLVSVKSNKIRNDIHLYYYCELAHYGKVFFYQNANSHKTQILKCPVFQR
uniref:Uncharacterized protein n=1 Tax=Anguilla anguilla TaxID=7936 RepID=A0A0E9X4Z0_ANGAN